MTGHFNERVMLIFLFSAFVFSSCQKESDEIVICETENNPVLRIKIDVDPTQERLGNLGEPVSLPNGHAAQSPNFNLISGHYLELAPTAFTALGDGEILYTAPETEAGGENAIDFNQSLVVTPGETFLEIPLDQISAGDYEWVRFSLSYQNYDVDFSFNESEFTGTLASFVGYNTYIEEFNVGSESLVVNDDKLQGYWAFESVGGVIEGQSPAGATTVPNPLSVSSPIPAGSCVVTGEFLSAFTITGEETSDINLTLSLSTNQSFEWVDTDGDNKWDVGVGTDENVVDMGLRGLVPLFEL